MSATAATLVAIRVLVVALEFTDPIFSGNGIFGRSLVASMATEVLAHHDSNGASVLSHGGAFPGPRQIPVVVDVICARPVDERRAVDDGVQVVNHDAVLGHGVRAVSVPVPAQKWRRLDRQGPWREFAEQVEKHRDTIFATLGGGGGFDGHHVADLSGYSAVMAVDYTGAVALHKLVPQHELSQLQHHDRLHFLNFRVFAASQAWIPAEERRRLPHPQTFDQWWSVAVAADDQQRQDPEHPNELPDWLFYATIEAIAGKHCSSGFALCRPDVKELIANTEAVGLGSTAAGHWRVLLPPIRRDMAALARSSQMGADFDHHSKLRDVLLEIAPGSADVIRSVGDAWGRGGVALVTCVVRLDPAKEAMRFPEVIAAVMASARVLGGSDTDRRIVAFVAGAAGDRAYAADVVAAVRETGIDVVVAESFLNASAMAAVYAGAALNVHPSAYEAYGMTIVEAAACGVPTLVHHHSQAGDSAGGAGLTTRVGAAGELLLASADHVIPVSYDDWDCSGSDWAPAQGAAAFARPIDVAAMLLGRQPVRGDTPRLLHSADARQSMAEKALSYTEADLARTVLQHIAASGSHPPPPPQHGAQQGTADEL